MQTQIPTGWPKHQSTLLCAKKPNEYLTCWGSPNSEKKKEKKEENKHQAKRDSRRLSRNHRSVPVPGRRTKLCRAKVPALAVLSIPLEDHAGPHAKKCAPLGGAGGRTFYSGSKVRYQVCQRFHSVGYRKGDVKGCPCWGTSIGVLASPMLDRGRPCDLPLQRTTSWQALSLDQFSLPRSRSSSGEVGAFFRLSILVGHLAGTLRWTRFSP